MSIERVSPTAESGFNGPATSAANGIAARLLIDVEVVEGRSPRSLTTQEVITLEGRRLYLG